MTTKYKFTADKASKFKKHGVDLTVYNERVPSADVVYVTVDGGHMQEFIDVKSHFIYYIIEGNGVFILNDERIEAKATDLIVIPPNTRIYYFGKMKMTLTVTPAFKEENERHIRFIEEKENPFIK